MRQAWRRLQRVLITGVFVLAPIGLTLILLAWFLSLIDSMLAPVTGVLGRPIPGLGLLVALALVLAAGVLGSNLVGRHLLDLTEEFLLKIPVFNWIYRTVKQLSEVFSPSGKTSFKSVVMVEYPGPGLHALGFVTNKVTVEENGKRAELACVYIPTNHMYIGQAVLVPIEKVRPTSLSQQDGIQAIISAGAALPNTLRLPPEARP